MANEKLRAARRALGMLQADLASACGISQQAISNYERGAVVPERSTLDRLVEALRQTPDRLGYRVTWREIVELDA